MKRALDLLVSISVLLLLSPLLLICILAIRLTSRGPAFFSQERLGIHGKPFRIYKFRSMYTSVPDIRNADGSSFSGENDARVTPVGRLLRKTSFDEIPQLINVVRGEMSLVGPRPDQVDQIAYYTPQEKRKLEVKPGITGLAQINGRNSLPWDRRKALDVEYVERQSLRLDMAILLKTVPYVLRGQDLNTSDAKRGREQT